jgi:hypothetical protein
MSEEILETDEVINEVTNEVINEVTNEVTNKITNEENKFEQYILIKIVNDKTYYQCKLCNVVYDLKGNLKKHLEKKKKCYVTDLYQCKYCKKKFIDNSTLNKHLQKKNKCYYKSELNIVIENNIYSKIEKLESNEEKLKKQILDNEKEIKRLKDSLLEKQEEIQQNKKRYDDRESDIYHTLFESYINKFANLDLMFFTSNFIRNNRYDTRVMEYKKFIINLFDKIRLETLKQIFEGIDKYKKQKNFELLLKDYQKELELRNKNNEFKKIKYTSLEFQLQEINNFIKKNYENE